MYFSARAKADTVDEKGQRRPTGFVTDDATVDERRGLLSGSEQSDEKSLHNQPSTETRHGVEIDRAGGKTCFK